MGDGAELSPLILPNDDPVGATVGVPKTEVRGLVSAVEDVPVVVLPKADVLLDSVDPKAEVVPDENEPNPPPVAG